jgi:hypothetical protein
MKLSDAAKREAKRKALEQWHPWFAWHPVMLENGDAVWMEHIERRREFVSGYDGTYVFDRYRKPAEDTP